MLSQASQIKDERKQKSGTVEYVHDKTTYTASFINSVERDYKSDTGSFSLKQDMFGDLTTLSLAFSNTNDTVGENNGTAFVPVITWLGHAESRSYDIDLSQILTKNFIAGVNFNVITDQGYLANPYRSVRYLDPSNRQGLFAGKPGLSRHAHQHGDSGGGQVLPALSRGDHRSYRYFRDTWDIVGNTYELDYTHPISNIWILEGRFRYYKQNHANFYSDLFAYADEYRFEAATRISPPRRTTPSARRRPTRSCRTAGRCSSGRPPPST